MSSYLEARDDRAHEYRGAHYLSTIFAADLILVMDRRQIVERDIREQLSGGRWMGYVVSWTKRSLRG